MIPKTLVAASVRPIILSILSDGETYGYAIVQRIRRLSGGRLQWSDGTLYPVLHKLETDGFVSSTWRKSESGRKRKYYQLTPTGLRAMESEKEQWLGVHAILEQLWGLKTVPA